MLDTVANYHCIQFQGKLMIQTQENDEKPHFGSPNSFLKNLASPVTRYHGQLSSCTISEKTNNPILRKFCDGRTDRLTDRLTDRRTDRRTRVIS